MQTGENEQDLRKILDMTRMIGIVLLILHFYYYCYAAFHEWNLTRPFGDHLMRNVSHTGLFKNFHTSKLFALLFLVISLLGARGRKDEKIKPKKVWMYAGFGLCIYFISALVLYLSIEIQVKAIVYMALCTIGYLMVLSWGTRLSRVIKQQVSQDVFNKDNETFPQEERLLENEFSVNLPTRYRLNGKIRNGWLSIVNPARGCLCVGSPGAGKTYFFIAPVIRQLLAKQHTLLVYDLKFPDLSIVAYNHFLKHRNSYSVRPEFYLINFDDLSRCHRCNPIDPSGMYDITDAVESARTVMLGLNREWIKKQGDFWVESSINFVTAIIWFLRKYKDGKYCTLPHAIELMQVPYDKLFPILGTEPEISAYVSPFQSAFATHTTEQLEGQVGGTKIAIARLSSPTLYYVLSGNDFTLDINNPEAPKILCLTNNPQKVETYGAVLSLYITRLVKLINKKGQLKSGIVIDEFPSIFLKNIDALIASARSNLVSTFLAVQSLSQLKAEYSKEQAEVIMTIMANIICGQASGETAKFMSDLFGKILQSRESLSINAQDTSVSRSKQLEQAIPASRISSLSSGEFCGIVADNPDQKIELKSFHAEIVNDHAALKAESDNYAPIPAFREVNTEEIMCVYKQIHTDVQNLQEDVIRKIIQDPSLHYLIPKKGMPPGGRLG